MRKTIIDELLELQQVISNPEDWYKLKRYQLIWHVSEALSNILIWNNESDILARLDLIIRDAEKITNHEELWKIVDRMKILITDILMILPSDIRNKKITASKKNNGSSKVRRKSISISLGESGSSNWESWVWGSGLRRKSISISLGESGLGWWES